MGLLNVIGMERKRDEKKERALKVLSVKF